MKQNLVLILKQLKKYSIFIFYISYALSLIHFLHLTTRGFGHEIKNHTEGLQNVLKDFVRIYTFIIVYNAILIYNLLLRKRLAYLFIIVLLFGGIFFGIIRHMGTFRLVSSYVQVFTLLINWSEFQVNGFHHNLKQKLANTFMLLAGLGIYYIFGFFALSNSFTGSLTLQNIISNYLANFIDPTNIDFYIDNILPQNFFARLYLNTLEYIGWVILGLIIFNFLLDVKIKTPSLKTNLSPELTEKIIKFDADSLAVFKTSQNLYTFNYLDGQVFYEQDQNVKIILGNPLFKTNYDPEAQVDSEMKQNYFKELINFSHQNGKIISFFQTNKETADILKQFGLSSILMGHEAIISLKDFNLETSANKNLRYSSKKLERDNVVLEFVEFQNLTLNQIEVIKNLRTVWLKNKGNVETKFSTGFWPLNPKIPGWAVFAKDSNFGYLAVCTFLPFDQNALALDFMLQSPFSKPGLMDGILVKSILEFQQKNYTKLSLGLAPVDIFNRNNITRSVSKPFEKLRYKYEGLRKFKQKFNPSQEERYLVLEGFETLPIVLKSLSNVYFKKHKHTDTF